MSNINGGTYDHMFDIIDKQSFSLDIFSSYNTYWLMTETIPSILFLRPLGTELC